MITILIIKSIDARGPRMPGGYAWVPMNQDVVCKVYRMLYAAYGPQGWWPGEGALEIVAGAILTQRTAWQNAERALENLDRADLLSISALGHAPVEQVAETIRPSGCYREKAKKLASFAVAVERRTGGDLAAFLDRPSDRLRQELLSIHGIGPETADAILLYAAKHPTFVVDAYTRRLFERLGYLRGDESYEAIRGDFAAALPPDVDTLGEYHALIVRHGKTHCRKRPVCDGCRLVSVCPLGAAKEAA